MRTQIRTPDHGLKTRFA